MQPCDVLQGKPTCRGALVRNSCGALTLSHASSASRAIPLACLSSPLTSGAGSASSILLQPGCKSREIQNPIRTLACFQCRRRSARFRDRPPAGACRHTRADRRSRLRRTVIPPLHPHPLRSIRRSQGRGVSHQIALHTCQLLGPTVPYPDTSAVRPRRPAVSAFASESHLRSPGGISGPAGHPDGEARRCRADLECRCINSHAARQARQSAGETPIDRSLRGERRRSDGKASTLRSSRADLAAFRAYHASALGTFSHRRGCAGPSRSHPSHSFSISPPTSWERGERREQVASIQPQAGIGRVLVWACFVRRKFSPHLAYSDRKRASGCSHATSKHRAASAGLLATAGEPASCAFLMRCIRDASRWQQQACV